MTNYENLIRSQASKWRWFFKLEHSKAVYLADYTLYGITVLWLTIYLLSTTPRAHFLAIGLLVLVGLASWTLIEYLLHRYILHGLQPFRAWHLQHHRRPKALICTSTLVSSSAILLLVFMPATLLGDLWRASALTLGLLIGYLGYAITHHAIHHWHVNNAWLRRRKRAHAQHHHITRDAHYGVTSGFWDDVFGSNKPIIQINVTQINPSLPSI